MITFLAEDPKNETNLRSPTLVSWRKTYNRKLLQFLPWKIDYQNATKANILYVS